MTDHDEVWRRCVWLGRCVVPLLDLEEWRRGRRRERFSAWGVEVALGERLLGIFAALVFHAVWADSVAAGSAGGVGALDRIPLRVVREAAVSKADYAFLAGLPPVLADADADIGVTLLRVLLYSPGRTALLVPRLGNELRHALEVLGDRYRVAEPTCGSLGGWAEEAGVG